MGYLLECLGRGLLGSLSNAFEAPLGDASDEPTASLLQAAQERPSDSRRHVQLGRRYLKEGRFSGALETFKAALDIDAHALVPRIGLACALDELGRADEAIKHLRTAQKQDPTDPAILFTLGLCHERRNELELARRYYNDALTYCPQLRNAHERLAAIAVHDGDTQQALRSYELLSQWDPGSVDVRMTFANLLLRGNDPQAAIEQFERALTIEPENWVAHNDLASAYEQAGLLKEAIEQLHIVVEEQPGFPDTHLRLGDLYAKIGNGDAAVQQYRAALDIQPDYLEAVVKMGTQHLRSGVYIEAARWFNRAVEINDRLLTAYVGLGVAQRDCGRQEEAMASFEMAASIEPNSTLLFSEMARLQLKAAVCQDADRTLGLGEETKTAEPGQSVDDLIEAQIRRHRNALEERPNHADMYYRLGLLLRNRGRNEEAIDAFRQAVDINPSYVKALIKLGLALKDAGETDEAIEVLGRALELKPEFVDLHYHLGLLFAERNRFELAVEHFEQAVKGNRQNVDFHANLALALQNMGLLDRAAATWQSVCELIPAGAGADGPATASGR